MDTIRLIALMIVGTLLGITLCFFNRIFKKPYLYIRNMFFCGIIGLFIAIILGGTVFKEQPQWVTAFCYVIFPITLGSCSVFLGLLEEKTEEIVSMGITGPLAFFILSAFTKMSVVSAGLTALGIMLILIGLGFFFTKQYFSFECSFCGAYLIAALYTDCFRLPQYFFFSVFTALTITGTMLGIFLKKKVN